MWTIDVLIAHHDNLKGGGSWTHHSRVHLSKDDFPDALDAEQAAAVFAISMHGGMATDIRMCL